MSACLLEKKDLIEQYLNENPGQLSSLSFVSIFAWQDFFKFDVRVMDDYLCIFASNEVGTFLYLPPLGQGDISQKVITSCFDWMTELNRGKGVSRIENVQAHQLASFPAEKFSCFNKGYEYCYYRQDITALEGNLYKSKRSSYNHFVKNNSFRYAPYDDNMLESCIGIYADWARGRRELHADKDVYCQMLEENAQVHRLVMRHYKELGLVGRVVEINGQVKAYTFGYLLSKNIFCVLFEVTDLAVNGLSVFIFRELCQDAAVTPCQFINVMDDFELENVRRTKMSFHPVALFPSYTVKENCKDFFG